MKSPRGKETKASVREKAAERTGRGRTRVAYPQAFREQMIAMARGGRTPEDLSREFEPSAQTIRNWVDQADRDEGRRTDGLTTPEREELVQLRRDNRRLQEERDILKKAAAWFAREADALPKRSSNS